MTYTVCEKHSKQSRNLSQSLEIEQEKAMVLTPREKGDCFSFFLSVVSLVEEA